MAKKRFYDVVNSTCQAYNAKSNIVFKKGYPATVNHSNQSTFAFKVAKSKR